MALTPIGLRQATQKKSPWDTVAQTMGVVNAAVGAATGINSLVDKATKPAADAAKAAVTGAAASPAPRVGPAATPGMNYAPPAAGPLQPGVNPMQDPASAMRRRMGMFY